MAQAMGSGGAASGICCDGEVWQDREIRFDALPQLLQNRRGEVTIDSINSVEDTKGS